MARIIAEFCQNHNGDFELLSKMVEAAARAGATHGKMQTIYANTISFRPQFEEGLIQGGRVRSIKRPYKDEVERLSGLEISEESTVKFIDICKNNGLVPMTTCFVRSHVESLSEIGFESIKVASYDCASFTMLREIKEKFDEIVVSTGATFDEEVAKASKVLFGANFSFLHCVTLYPTPLNQMHMARMGWLRNFSKEVGYSDHSLVSKTGLLASKAALALGADLIERHFTLLSSSESRDGPVSINEMQLKEIVNFSKLSIEERTDYMNLKHPDWGIVVGKISRKLSDEELLNRDYYRGRFANPRPETKSGERMYYNWEEIS